MKHVLYLAWCYLSYHRIKTSILIFSITLIIFLPVGLRVLVDQSEEELSVRAETTPLLVGAKGSPLELVLNSLYFESDVPPAIGHGQVARVGDSGLARAIPLYTRFRSGQYPIIGTSLDYFDFRHLEVKTGRQMAVLGECLLGADVADALGAVPGEFAVSSPETVFDLAGVYPLRMKIVGILRRSHTPDDRAIFVDIKTSWVIEGLGHGHQDMARPEAAPGVLRRDGNKVVTNASVVQYNEITDKNMDSFHFHGDTSDFPVTAVIVVPNDDKASALLRGRYLSEDERVQIVAPDGVIAELLSTILTVQTYVVTAVVLVGLSTLATAVLVFLLSLRLRRREIETMSRIGGSRRVVVAVLSMEIVGVVVAGIVLAAGLTILTSLFGSTLIRAVILS